MLYSNRRSRTETPTVKAKRRKAVARPSDKLSVTTEKDGQQVYDPRKAHLAGAVVALGWDCVIDEDGIDPDEWARRFVSKPDDAGMRQRFLRAFTAYLNEQLPRNDMVADLYVDADGKMKVKLRLALDGAELMKRLKRA